ncbi:MAG TPA: MFS transporter [Pseudolysinimonas sp.]|nr:MFS transporter [Pseudolysinimonas sp.]
MNSRRSWVVFGAAVALYLIAVLQRTTFGVAGVEATTRFDVAAAALSTVAVVQIVVYAALQIPVGLIVDRWGPRVMLATGALVMAGGQAILAFSDSLGWALLARILVGAGDALTFVSALRLVPYWFSGRRVPLLTQVLGMTGQLGQVLAAFPFAILLGSAGWRPAFLTVSGASLGAVILALALVRTRETVATSPVSIDGVLPRLRSALARPGTQLGFWAHLLGGSGATMMAALWGYPYLRAALGYSQAQAGAVFSLFVVGTLASAPLIGFLVARFPLRRSNVVLSVVAVQYLSWAVLLLWPGRPPLAAVIVLFLALGTGGPGSLVGFDFARTFNPSSALGSASGIVNSGGFLGAFVGMFGVGVVLDLMSQASSSDLYSLDSFRVAFVVPFIIAAGGVVGLLHARHRTRRVMFEEEGIVVAPLWVALFRRGECSQFEPSPRGSED